MTTLTLELPDNLARKIETKGISEQQLNAVILRFIQLYLDEENKQPKEQTFKISGAEFARRFNNNNSQLFEELAKL